MESKVAVLIGLLLVGCAFGSAAGCAATTPHVATDAAPPPPSEVSAPAAPTASTCGRVPLTRANEPLDFCYADPNNQGKGAAASVTVIYYFHGFGGDASELFTGRDRPLLDTLLKILGARAPIVASLSLGPAGALGDDTDEIFSVGLPAIEGVVAPGKNVRRILVGGSMGGHNVLRLAAAGGRAKFQAAAALCPALATFNGYDDAAIAAYRARNGAVLNEALFAQALAAFRVRIPTADDWDANNPFTFEERGAYDGMPLFLSVGTEDTLGFLEGSREFLKRAKARTTMFVDYHEVPGVHCSFDGTALIAFLGAQLAVQ